MDEEGVLLTTLPFRELLENCTRSKAFSAGAITAKQTLANGRHIAAHLNEEMLSAKLAMERSRRLIDDVGRGVRAAWPSG